MASEASDDGIEIVDLRDRPEMAEAVAQAQYDEWKDFVDMSLDELRPHFVADTPPGELPVTLIAVAGDRLGGAVSLREVTLGAVTHPEVYIDGVSPWLSNMWVAEWARGKGLATDLSAGLLDVARDQGYQTVYSSTATEDSLYHKLGFHTIGMNMHREISVYLIKLELA
jgi:GNAT superfamily N-acetyltransferase